MSYSDKQELLKLMKMYPDWHNIEYLIELGWNSATWKKVTNELLAEGKIHKTIKHTYFACRNEDGSIKTGMIKKVD